MSSAVFPGMLLSHVRNEFTAGQQYTAIAVWFDRLDLPRLAARFYTQAVEERNHAMMMIRYMIDRGWPVEVPGVDEVRNTFDEPSQAIALAASQEQRVSDECAELFRAARADGDALSEQFMHWFLKEQVEEVASMTSLLTIAERAGADWFQIENHLARTQTQVDQDTSAPEAAGGRL